MSPFDQSRRTNLAKAGVTITVQEAHSLQQEGAQLIDVREPYEFAQGHASGARNIPLDRLAERLTEIATDRVVLLICESGVRSQSAQAGLVKRNITNTRNVQGGTGAWRRAGLPME